MQFEDRILVQLGDSATRQALFTPGLAERLLAAAFGPDGPYAPPFSFGATTVTLGVRAVEDFRLRATWRMPDGRVGGEVDAVLPFAAAPESGLVSAVVEGTVAASMAPVTGRIAAVGARTAELPGLAAIEAGVPAADRTDPATFERRRRILLGQAIGGALADDEAAGLADRTLAATQAGTVAEFLASPDGPAAIARLAPRHAVPVIWFIPRTGFDDADWPGAEGAAREGRAAAWLAEQGVALMSVA